MRTQTVLLLLLFPFTGALAANWERVAEFPTVLAEIDTESVKARGDLIEATFRFNHSAPQINRGNLSFYLSAEVKALFNCKHKMYSPYHRIEFEKLGGEGAIVGKILISDPEINLVPIIPSSMNEQMLLSACSSSPKPAI